VKTRRTPSRQTSLSTLAPPPTPAASVECCDWLVLARDGGIPRASIDMVYVDPPFNTGTTKRGTRRAGTRSARPEGATPLPPPTYADRWATMDSYVHWLRERLVVTLPLLNPSASVLVHCDWRASHHIRLLLDDLLGPECFANHLIWSYGLGGSSPRMFARKHDDILLYGIVPARRYFSAPRVPATSQRLKGQTKKATDVLAIPSLNNMSVERTGYPTQKPLALLELLIQACCPPGGTVLDPCCGSGTTLVAALRTGRHAVGSDQSHAACALARTRIAALSP
jgi:DNA modification methylase